MMSTEPIVEFTELEHLDFEVPCDYDRLGKCGGSAAHWVMIARCPCGAGAVRLACGACKNMLVSTENALSCPSECGEVFAPARRAFSRVEWLR